MSDNKDFEFSIPPMEQEIVVCDNKEELLDYNWLFSNIPWTNHSNKVGKINFDEKLKMYAIKLDGSDTKSAEIVDFEFDVVEIMSMHGFCGNSYDFTFMLGDEKIFHSHDLNSIAFSKEDVRQRYINKLERRIKGLNNQIKYKQEAIDRIKKL